MKKTKLLTRLGAVVFALAILFAMSVPALADDAGNVYTGSGNTLATGVAGSTSIPLTKSIVFFNENGSSVYEPNLTYAYTVAPQNPGNATVTDDGSLNNNTPVTVKVNQGPTGGVYFANGANVITFSSTNNAVTASATGTEVEKSTNLSVDLTQFTHAGVFRYVITETTTEDAKNAQGVLQGDDFDDTRYLDVYIQNDGTGLALYGAVIFKTDSTVVNDAGTDSINTSFKKTTGFDPATDESSGTIDYSSETAADTYTTYDFSVKKEVSGSLADKSNEFPFYVNVTNTISGAKYTYFDDPGTGAGAAETISGTSIAKGTNSASSTLTLKHGDYVKFVGVPSNTSSALSIDVTEWNNTPDKYTPSVAATNGSPALVSSSALDTGASASLTTFDLKTNDAAGQIITITNTISEISPTGLAFRIAPYVLMLAAGVSLIVLFIKRKRETTDMI